LQFEINNNKKVTATTHNNIYNDCGEQKVMIVYNENFVKLFVSYPEGKRPLGRPRRRWIDNNKVGLLEIGVIVVDWIGLAQDRYRWRALVNSVMNLRVP
jgi:hypothetical protein